MDQNNPFSPNYQSKLDPLVKSVKDSNRRSRAASEARAKKVAKGLDHTISPMDQSRVRPTKSRGTK